MNILDEVSAQILAENGIPVDDESGVTTPAPIAPVTLASMTNPIVIGPVRTTQAAAPVTTQAAELPPRSRPLVGAGTIASGQVSETAAAVSTVSSG